MARTQGLSDLEELAVIIAIVPPLRRNKRATETRISWPLIELLREELTRRGVDWRGLHKSADEIVAMREKKEEPMRGNT